MNFLYCNNCGNMRPRGWIIFTKRCEICHSDMERVKVNMTMIAPFYYASIAGALIVLMLFLGDYQIPLGSMLVIVLMGLALVLAFIDYSISYTKVKEILKDRVPANPKLRVTTRQ